MNRAYIKLFWGFLFALVEIHIMIDILPDPVGYFLICSGIASLLAEFPVGGKAYYLAMALGFATIPTIFIPQNAYDGTLQLVQFWGMYAFFVGIVKLVLVFYVFQLMIEIAGKREWGLVKRTNATFKYYISIMLVLQLYYTFTINLYGGFLSVITFFVVSAGMVMEIVFLVLLFRFRKIQGSLYE